jgi:hypothetical protein
LAEIITDVSLGIRQSRLASSMVLMEIVAFDTQVIAKTLAKRPVDEIFRKSSSVSIRMY